VEKFEKGQEVYGIDGRAASYIASHQGEHIVSPWVEDDDGAPWASEAETWSQVFTKPPRDKLDADVAELTAKAAQLRKEIHELGVQKRESERSQQATKERLMQHEALKRIDDYLQGKFTLFLELPQYSSVPRIRKLGEVIENGDGERSTYNPRLRLLSLYGDSKGDLNWGVSRYYDGSGSNEQVFPIDSEDEGIAIIRKRFAKMVADWRVNGNNTSAFDWIRKLPAGWIDPPKDMTDKMRENDLKYKTDAVEKAKTALATAETQLAEALAKP